MMRLFYTVDIISIFESAVWILFLLLCMFSSLCFVFFGCSSMFSVTSVLTNNILGSGMLGLPHAFSECGLVLTSSFIHYHCMYLLSYFFLTVYLYRWLLGSILMVISAISSSFALHILGISAKKVGVPSNYYVGSL